MFYIIAVAILSVALICGISLTLYMNKRIEQGQED